MSALKKKNLYQLWIFHFCLVLSGFLSKIVANSLKIITFSNFKIFLNNFQNIWKIQICRHNTGGVTTAKNAQNVGLLSVFLAANAVTACQITNFFSESGRVINKKKFVKNMMRIY